MKAIRGNLVTSVGVIPGQIEFDEEITYIGEARSFEGELDEYREALIAPGFIDIHVHGLAGYDTMDDEPESLHQISKHLAAKGVTGFLATIQTSPYDAIIKTLRRIRETETTGAKLLGSHLEGPYINPERIGAQRQNIREPNENELHEILDAADGSLRLVTMAPEIEGGILAVEYLAGRGVLVSAGHTNATYEEAIRGFEAGVVLLAHCWNGMRGLHHREPGVIGAGLTDNEVFVEVIADCLHVHPAILGLTVKAKGPDKVVLVSDSIKPAGLKEGKHVLDGRNYNVEDGLVRLGSGVIAGSSIGLNDAVRNMVNKVGLTISEAVQMACDTPARLLGLNKGSLEAGYDADLVVLDTDFNVVETIVEGTTVYRTE
ncbi:MAG: N-acetylglucosamine-6-phosphate deacetylase [Candidatus Bathyarchaeota archaeon]|nr:N-acetylglucosamine-6-phosphate deacetylase [Candidatus Bathyarchaeota archaeon]